MPGGRRLAEIHQRAHATVHEHDIAAIAVPQSGPPLATYFSWRKDMAPFPPFRPLDTRPHRQTWLLLHTDQAPGYSAPPASSAIHGTPRKDRLFHRQKGPPQAIGLVLNDIVLYWTAACWGYTLTCFLSRPLRSNFTTPSTMANRVSSLPRPTLLPGWILVPLADQNITGQHKLPVSPLGSQADLLSRPLRSSPPFLC